MRDIDVDFNIGKIQKVKFLWNNHVINLFPNKLGASKITVQHGEDGTACVSFIPPKSFLYLSIRLSLHTHTHTITRPPIHISVYSSIRSSLSVHLLNHLPIHLSIQPFIFPTIHLNSPSIHPIHFGKSDTIFLKPKSTWQEQGKSCKV